MWAEGLRTLQGRHRLRTLSKGKQVRMHITEAQAERIADDKVWRRLVTDARYIHAQSGEEQAARQDEVEAEVWAEVERRYAIEN